MVKRNLGTKLRRKVLPFLAGALGTVYGCGDGPTPPVIIPPPVNQSPVAEFTVNPKDGYAPLRADFNGSSSRDPDGSVVKYRWDFGDGSADSTSGASVSHTYSNLGSHNSCLTVEDNKGARSIQSCNSVNVNPVPSARVSGYLEDVLTGEKIANQPVLYQNVAKDTTDNNGAFDFQVPANTNDTLKVISSEYYNLKLPVNTTASNISLNNVQMIKRYVDPITNEDLLTFMKNYMRESRWDDADLPIKVWIDNNVPSPEYREKERLGLVSWDTAVNQWLPTDRKLVLSQVVSSDPTVGIRTDYVHNKDPEFSFNEGNVFRKGIIVMNSLQGATSDAVSRTFAHEFGHGLGIHHTPYSNHNMYGTRLVLPSPFEGLVVATKYKLKKDVVGLYNK